MKLILAFVAFLAVGQAAQDWSNLKPKDLHVTPQHPAPLHPKIVGGEPVTPHSYPYQVALNIGGAFCGGSLIREDVVLTAAHCADGASSIEVKAGAHMVHQAEATQQIITSNKFIVHEEWDGQLIKNDIALIILPQKFELNENVQLVALHEGDCPDTSLDGLKATVSGWGKYYDWTGVSPVLRHVTADVLSNQKCKQSFSIIEDTNICMNGSGGKSSCNGDSGGPMVINFENGVEEVGIVSFGSGWGCEWGFPSAYTRVSCYTDWIKNNMP